MSFNVKRLWHCYDAGAHLASSPAATEITSMAVKGKRSILVNNDGVITPLYVFMAWR
jgi:hypothetical protein